MDEVSSPEMCPWCGAALSRRALYCSSCARQARCKSCKELLESAGRACVICGALAGGEAVGVGGVGFVPPMNTFEYAESEDGQGFKATKQFKASVSDAAMSDVGGMVGILIGAGTQSLRDRRIARPINAAPAPGLALTEGVTTDGMSSDDEAEELARTQNGEAPRTHSAPADDPAQIERQRLRRVFRYDGERVLLDETRLKATSTADFYRRLTVLFLYAHYLDKRERVARDALHAVLTDANVLDNNCRHWLNSAPELFNEGTSIGLRAAGRDRAKEVLRELDDPSVAPEWKLGAASHARAPKGVVAAEEGVDAAPKAGRRRPTGSKRSQVDGWLEAWRALALPVRGHDAIKGRPLLDKGIFGLWAIRRATKDEVKAVGTKSLAKFIFAAFEDKLNPRSFEKALDSEAAKGKVVRVTGTTFQIQPPGMQFAEKMAGLGANTVSPSAANGHASSPVQTVG